LDHKSCYKAVLARDRRYDGRFFTAVITTGIYCRPICPARTPKEKNCLFLPSAAAAQAAGFRPCLRCRPELSPNFPGWHGTSATVTRALRYISEGFLNDHNIPQLADKLGIGERHFRRLFQKHMGTSANIVALNRRLSIAKQLLTETSLSVTQVALASGFQSLRRFNDALKKHFRLKPIEIKKHHAAPQNNAESLTLQLSYNPPFDWGHMTNYLSIRAIPGVEAVEGNRYSRSFQLNGKSGSFTVFPHPDKEILCLTIHNAAIPSIPLILSRVRSLFDLDSNIDIINHHLSAHPDMAWRVKATPGLRVMGAWDPFELTIRAILGQQVTVAAATTLSGRIVARHGLITDTPEKKITHIFPTAQILVDADLSELGITHSRIRAIHHLARMLVDDPLFFQRATNLDDFVSTLCHLPGIGPWTANYVAMRAMKETDAFPGSDLILLKRMQKNGKRPTARKLETISEDWRPWRAYAAMYLWANDTGNTEQDICQKNSSLIISTQKLAP